MSKIEHPPLSIRVDSIVATRFHTDLDSEEAINNLPEFSDGTADNPGKGYQALERSNSETLEKIFGRYSSHRTLSGHHDKLSEMDDIVLNPTEVNSYLDESSGEFVHFSFKYETWEETEADVGGERQLVHVPETHTSIGHWNTDGAIFFHGRDSKRAFDDLTDRLDDRITFDKVNFDSDFLLWLVYKCWQNEPSSKINIRDIFSARFTDNESRTGLVSAYPDEDSSKFGPLFSSILSGGELMELSVLLETGEISFVAQMNQYGELTLTSFWPREEMEPESAYEFYPALAQEVVDLTSHWQSLSREEKYPDASFFIDVYEGLDDRLKSNTSLSDVVEKYTLKRTQGVAASEEVKGDTPSNEPMANPRREEIYEDVTIADALEIVESEILESKEEIPEHVEQIAKEVAALANTRGGALILGMGDNGELTGLSDAREDEERVAGVITQSIEPPVDVNLRRRSIADADLLVITVDQATQTPRSVNGKYYKRVGTTIQELGPEELTRMIREGE